MPASQLWKDTDAWELLTKVSVWLFQGLHALGFLQVQARNAMHHAYEPTWLRANVTCLQLAVYTHEEI